MKKIKISFILIFLFIGLTNCYGEPKHYIEGLTDEIYEQCSGIWTVEKYIKNVQISGGETSWGKTLGWQRGFSILIDLRTDEEFEIWPDMEPLVVKKVIKVDEITIKMIVSRPRSYMSEKGEWVPYEDTTIVMYLLGDHRMWLDTKVDDGTEGGSLIYQTGSDYIYKKISGPSMEPPCTNETDEKELMTPP